jgi:chlorobactene glucosyltransferase
MLISIVLLGIILAVTLFNTATAPMLKKSVGLRSHPRVSVLIPARNEEANVGACLEGFLSQNYRNFEIRVLNDQSTDHTGAIIERFGEQYPEVQAIQGKPLPAGWSGKNWACHQLSQHADGEILIFTDADNRPAPNAIMNTVAYMQKLELGLLSAFPEKVTGTLAEKLVVPVVDMFVYAGLPLWLTYFSRFPSLAAASGLWIAFTREAYQLVGGHQAVSNQIVEDVELSRLAKKRGIKILTSAGTRVVSCRMYHSFSEVWNGFSKNLFGLVRYKTIPFFILMLGLFTMCVLPYMAIWFAPLRGLTIVAIVMNIVMRIALSLKYRHPFFTSVILHPFGVLLTLLIGINSFFQVRRGRLQWKDRHIDLKIGVSSQQSAAAKRISNRELS